MKFWWVFVRFVNAKDINCNIVNLQFSISISDNFTGFWNANLSFKIFRWTNKHCGRLWNTICEIKQRTIVYENKSLSRFKFWSTSIWCIFDVHWSMIIKKVLSLKKTKQKNQQIKRFAKFCLKNPRKKNTT